MKKSILSIASLFAIAALALFQSACNDDHDHDDHDHGDGHEHHEDGDKDDHGHKEKGGHTDADHDHDHDKPVAGPNGGRVIHSVEPHLEFLVTEDRKVQITALDDDSKAIATDLDSVSLVGGERSNPVKMTFDKSGAHYVSNVAFPEGNDFPVVLQIKTSADGEKITEKFNLNLSDCPTCDYKEYACVCDHADDDHDHDHDDKKKKD